MRPFQDEQTSRSSGAGAFLLARRASSRRLLPFGVAADVRRHSLLLLVLLLPFLPLQAATPTPHPLQILANECFPCHREDKAKGGLVLTSREAILKGGGNGTVAAPGQPAQSRLIDLLRKDGDPHMPPKKQLPPTHIRALEHWIQEQMPWDDSALDDASGPIAKVALEPLPASHQPVQALAFVPGTNFLAVARGPALHILALHTNTPPVPAPAIAHPEGIETLAVSPDGRLLATAGFRRVRLWNLPDLSPAADLTNGVSGRITSLAFSPDSTQLAAGDATPGLSAQVRLLDLSSRRWIRSWRAHGDSVLGLQYSADASRLVTAGADRLVRVWSLPDAKPVATLEGHTAQVLSAGFNTNATQVVSGGADKQLFVWDIVTREKLVTLGNHSHAVNATAWPDDSREVFAATEDGALLRYENLKTHTGEQSSASGDERRIASIPGHLQSFAVRADRKQVAAGTQAGLVVVWNRDGKELTRLAPASLSAVAPAVQTATSARKPARSEAPPSKPSPKSKAAPVPRPEQFARLSVYPEQLVLSADAPTLGYRVTGLSKEGREYDLTDLAKTRIPSGAPFEVSAPGEFTAFRGNGSNTVTLSFGKLSVALPVVVNGPGKNPKQPWQPQPASFTRDVLPQLARAGCASGGCHSKPEGQNGFKLSVFSYDPKSDHAEIIADVRGRRLFPAAPEQSLLLQKPLLGIPHEGGRRIEAGSATHTTIQRWIRDGAPFALTNEPTLATVEVFPSERTAPSDSSHRLLVRARYSDGSIRDVTRLAAFESSDRELAAIDEHGRFTAGKHPGTAVIVARYMGQVAATRVLVPAERLLPPERYAQLPTNNFIDPIAHARFQRLGLLPSETCTDAEFLRRLKLDAIGMLPTPAEVTAFLNDPSPDKRRTAIDRVLEDPAYADFWAGRWADLLRPNSDRVGVKSVFVLDQWIREQFRLNRPYNEFVRDLLTAEGANHRDGPAVVYRDRRDPPELTTLFSQVLLGVRLECARCHHHPNEKWSQEDFYQLAACFGPVRQKGAGLSPPISAGRESFYFAKGGTVKHPVTGEVMPPRAPDGPLLAAGDADPRIALADWATATNNPFLARALVNRVWAFCFGRGLVEPVDDFRLSNPCVQPELLDALAADFTANGYDLKHLLRTLFNSRLYQLSTRPNETNLGDTRHFSRGYRRRLPAEVLDDAVSDITGSPDTFVATPPGSRATQTWSYKIESHFLDAFGRPNSSSDCPCERDLRLSVVQSLHLMNSPRLQKRISSAEGRARKLAESKLTPEAIVTELYLAAYGRPPLADEVQAATAPFRAPDAKRTTAVEDVLWSLLNSPEFLFNH